MVESNNNYQESGKGYVPNYVPGNIVVNFKRDYDEDFAKQLGKPLGCEYLGDVFGGAFLFKVPIGKEKDIMNIFSGKYSEFIEWTELYDFKLQSRFDSINILENMVADLDGSVESDKKFKSDLDEIIKYARKLKKSD